MNLRHTLPREAPTSQRPPYGNGWARAHENNTTYWSIWALTKDRKHLVNITVAVSNIEIASGGRWVAAMKLRDARKQLKMNQITRTIEYALLKADELTAAEIGTATGYAANEVQAGLKALVEAKLAHKAGKAWRWGVLHIEGATPAPTTPATGTYRSEPVPAILARPGGQDAYRLPSLYHKGSHE